MSPQHRMRKLINLDIKKEIISKRKSGENVGDLSAAYGMAKSTISTVLINKEYIKSAQVAKGIYRLSSSRCNITERMETLLLVWINENKWQVIVSVRRLFVKRPNNCLRNLVLRLLVQVLVMWRSFLAPKSGLWDLGKGLDYTVLWGMVKLLMEIGRCWARSWEI